MSALPTPTDGSATAARPRRRFPIDATLAGAAIVGLVMGGMLGGAATGIAYAGDLAQQRRDSAHAVPFVNMAPPPALVADEGAPVADEESDDADGDGEFDIVIPGINPPDAGVRPRTRRGGFTDRSLDSATYRIGPGRTTGYRDGRAVAVIVAMVDGKPVEVHTAAAFERMRATAARAGVQIRVVSGFRTMEHQRALYAAYRAGRGNLAAVPGHSNHQSGHALDLNVTGPGVLRWLDLHARTFGFRRTVPTENWHWEQW